MGRQNDHPGTKSEYNLLSHYYVDLDWAKTCVLRRATGPSGSPGKYTLLLEIGTQGLPLVAIILAVKTLADQRKLPGPIAIVIIL